MRRKEGWGGKKVGEEGGMRRVKENENEMKKLLRKKKNEEVAKRRIIGLNGPCFIKKTISFCKI